jgi:hypothetical protein
LNLTSTAILYAPPSAKCRLAVPSRPLRNRSSCTLGGCYILTRADDMKALADSCRFPSSTLHTDRPGIYGWLGSHTGIHVSDWALHSDVSVTKRKLGDCPITGVSVPGSFEDWRHVRGGEGRRVPRRHCGRLRRYYNVSQQSRLAPRVRGGGPPPQMLNDARRQAPVRVAIRAAVHQSKSSIIAPAIVSSSARLASTSPP